MKVLQSFPWIVPNNAKTPPLHIASSGERFSTLTGIKWLNDHIFVVNNRSGLRMAIFDINKDCKNPVAVSDLPHLTDDIDAKLMGHGIFEIAVSGCWHAHYSIYNYNLNSNQFEFKKTKKRVNKSFVHGVTYSPSGDLWLGIHTGKFPRVSNTSKNQIWRSPFPWGVRKVIFDPDSASDCYGVAVNANPKLKSYANASTSIWKLEEKKGVLSFRLNFNKIYEIDAVHSDSGCIFKSSLFLPDQRGNTLIRLALPTLEIQEILHHPDIDFPHGISINSDGLIALCNYGNSKINLISLS